ncbi:PREDICTED: glucose-fructose oxidoreductase domain-containing protein 1 [Dufourea novaeangliae]|uniref:Glucose-fructose oxidoreductase domain-containing protein 1 n=1 Tax=Dufourea novaeangliae TaxID=178035 RepID=A0A154PHI9_DUFNO|nr:PREDICTED: glucose-fructose oxidoreductase domain-containing protein 1 [Dufourea novaeangliae]KZC11315.1 Glucose-fructose oxidoreductase domain-containing protein 1 [Dufourea novaeangliae]
MTLPGIGVFGTGSIVRIIIPFLREKGFKIEAIWGHTLAEVSEVAADLEIPFHTSRIDDVLLRKDVDLIFIMCSPSLHAQIAVKALGIGKHVVCDKPAGLSQSDALKMVRAAQYYPSLISIVNHSLRFLPAFVNMKQVLEEGYLGGLVTVVEVRVHMGSLLHNGYDWLCDDIMGGGILALVGSHVIDLIFHLTGQRASRVHAVVRTFTQTTKHINGIRHVTSPDFCSFQMELSGGTLVTATLSNHLQGQLSQEVLICGGSNHLLARGGDLYGYRNGQEEMLYVDTDDLQDVTFSITDSVPRPYVKGLRNMISALRQAFQSVEDKRGWIKEPVFSASTFEDGLYVQAVIDALRQSNKRREWVKVNILTEEPDPNPLLSAAVRATAISI